MDAGWVCRHCLSRRAGLEWHIHSNQTHHVRMKCAACGRHAKYVTRTPITESLAGPRPAQEPITPPVSHDVGKLWGQDASPHLAFLDLETSGFQPQRHEILEVAVIVGEVERSWVVTPCQIETASPRALVVNGYHERLKDHPDAVGEQEMVQELLPLLRGCDLVGSNPSFDAGFLRAACCRHGLAPTWVALRDVGRAAQRYFGASRRLGLDAVIHRLGLTVPDGERHTAMGDVRLTMDAWSIIG